MAKYSRLEVAMAMRESGMIPLFFHSDAELGKKVLKACYVGGARLLEFTSRGDFAHEVFVELNKYALSELPGMILGVGSITDAGAASLYMQLEANFVKAIKGPCPWTDIMPTGGVSTEESNLRGWFEAGVTCVGMGSKLISKEILVQKDFKKLEEDVRKTLDIIKAVRS